MIRVHKDSVFLLMDISGRRDMMMLMMNQNHDNTVVKSLSRGTNYNEVPSFVNAPDESDEDTTSRFITHNTKG